MYFPSTIVRLDVVPLDIELKKPFGIAGGAQTIANNALVTVELADGTTGYGEAAPFPAFNGETQGDAVEAVLAARAVVVGADPRAHGLLAAALRRVAAESGSARCAIETAVLDALCRQARLPLWAFFGGAEDSLSTDITITVGSVGEAGAEASEMAARGFTRLKVKVGGPRAGEDLPRLVAIREAAPLAEILLDGNGGLSVEGAIDLVASLRARGIVPILFEQPVAGDDLEGLAAVARRTSVPVAADESVTTAADAYRVAMAGAAQVINVKLMKSGIAEARAIVAVAKAAGLGLMIGGMVEAKLAMSASACFAAGLGGFSFVDLDTPLFFAEEPFEGGYAQEGPRLDVRAIELGHGVSPKHA